MPQKNILGPIGFNSIGDYDNTKKYKRFDYSILRKKSLCGIKRVNRIFLTDEERLRK